MPVTGSQITYSGIPQGRLDAGSIEESAGRIHGTGLAPSSMPAIVTIREYVNILL